MKSNWLIANVLLHIHVLLATFRIPIRTNHRSITISSTDGGFSKKKLYCGCSCGVEFWRHSKLSNDEKQFVDDVLNAFNEVI